MGSERSPVIERLSTGPSRGTGPLVAVLVGLVAIAILKPWDVLAPAPGGLAGHGSVIGLPAASLALIAEGGPSSAATPEVALDPNATPCMSANGIRLVALIRTPTQDVRSWQLVDGAIGRDAFQPALAPLKIPSEHVVGLGLCGMPSVPSSTTERLAGQIAGVLLLDVGAGDFEELDQPDLLSAGDGPQDATLYAPPSGALLPVSPAGSRGLPQPIGAVTTPASASQPEARALGPGSILPTWGVGHYDVGFRLPTDPPGVVEWIQFDIVAAPGIFG